MRVTEEQPSPDTGQVSDWLRQMSGIVVLPSSTRGRIDFEAEAWRVSSTASRPANYVRRGVTPPAGVNGSIALSSPEGEEQILMSIVAQNDVGDHPALDVWLATHAPSMEPATAEITDRYGSTSVEVTLALGSNGNRKQMFDDGFTALLKAARQARFVASNPPTIDDRGHWTNGFTDMIKTLTEADLPVPPVPESMRPLILRRGGWFWSTVDISGSRMYGGRVRRGGTAEDFGDMFALANVGHGLNSYFLSYALTYRGERIAARYPWGGVYSDRERDRRRIVEGFEELRNRVGGLEQPTEEA